MFVLFLAFLGVFFRFGWEVLVQEFYIRTQLTPYLRRFLHKSDGTFSEADIKRMCYYARYVPAVSGASYALLVRRSLRKTERKNMLWLSACAPIFDDYFDNPALEEKILYEMIQAPESYTPTNTQEAILVDMLRTLKLNIIDFPRFMKICLQVFDAQIAAKGQENGNLSKEEIRKITFDKGGYSTLLFQALMEYPAIAGDEKAIYHFGGMVQWVDDIFDVYEDYQSQIQTLATMETSWKSTQQSFESELMVLFENFMQLPLPEKQKKRFLDLQFFFLSRTFVAIEQLQTLQGGNIFHAKNYTRKELICDMEKIENLRRWWQHFRRWKIILSNHLHPIAKSYKF